MKNNRRAHFFQWGLPDIYQHSKEIWNNSLFIYEFFLRFVAGFFFNFFPRFSLNFNRQSKPLQKQFFSSILCKPTKNQHHFWARSHSDTYWSHTFIVITFVVVWMMTMRVASVLHIQFSMVPLFNLTKSIYARSLSRSFYCLVGSVRWLMRFSVWLSATIYRIQFMFNCNASHVQIDVSFLYYPNPKKPELIRIYGEWWRWWPPLQFIHIWYAPSVSIYDYCLHFMLSFVMLPVPASLLTPSPPSRSALLLLLLWFGLIHSTTHTHTHFTFN